MKSSLLLVILFFNSLLHAQTHYRSIPIKLIIDDSVINVDSSLSITFSTTDTLITEYPFNGFIKIPNICLQHDYIQMRVCYKDLNAMIGKVPTEENLIYKDSVSWTLGFDKAPFNRDIINDYPIEPLVKHIFYWIIVYDEIEDVLVMPIDERCE